MYPCTVLKEQTSMKVLSLALLAGRPEGHFCFPFLLYESRFCRFSLNFASLVFYFSEKVVVNDCISILILNKQHESLHRRFDFFVYNLLLTLPSFIRIQFKILKLVFVISYVYKAFVQFSSHSIKLILKQFWNYSAEENPCCIFFLRLLISSSSILLSLFDTQIMNCLARHKNLSFF